MTSTFRIGRHEVPAAPWISPKVVVRPSAGRGRGLFAARPIAAEEVVLVWGGDSYCDAAEAARARSEGRGTMQWDEDLFSREADVLEDAFAINHACVPNVWMNGAFALTAMRAIRPGEELVMDYAMLLCDEQDPGDWDCRCGEASCRGRVTGSDWRLDSLRKRYAGHFSPILNQWIAEDRHRA